MKSRKNAPHKQKHHKKHREQEEKAISPVVATALLLVVAVTAVVAFQGWFVQFASSTFVNIEDESTGNLRSSDVQIVGDSLFFKNSDSDNLTVRRVEIEGNECTGVNGSYARGISDLNVSGCLGNVSTATPEIVMVTDQGVLEKKVYIDQYDISVENITGYYREISLNNPTGTDFIDQPYYVSLNTRSLIGNGKLKGNCENLRVKDSDRTTDLNHWVSACNYTNSYVYFEIPNLSASSTRDVYLYYGNESQNNSLSSYSSTLDSPWTLEKTLVNSVGRPFDVMLDSNEDFYAIGAREGGADFRFTINKWFANNDSLEWDDQNNPTGNSDRTWKGVVDSSDNVYMAGFQNGANQEIRVVKYDSNGNNLWNYSKSISSGTITAKWLTLNQAEDHIYIAGWKENSTDDVVYVEKLTTDGAYVWNYTSDPSGTEDRSRFIGSDASDNLYIGINENSSGNTKWRLEKITDSRDSVWNYTSDSPAGGEKIEGGMIDTEGNILLTGHQSASTGKEWRVEKISSSGENLWNFTYDLDTSASEYTYKIGEMNDGSYLAIGEDYSSDYDVGMVKINRNGSFVTNHIETSSGYEAAHGFAQFSNDTILIGTDGGLGGGGEDLLFFREFQAWDPSLSISVGSERTYE